jgi:hypothetical protein
MEGWGTAVPTNSWGWRPYVYQQHLSSEVKAGTLFYRSHYLRKKHLFQRAMLASAACWFLGPIVHDFCALRFRGLSPLCTTCNWPKCCAWASSVIAHGPNAPITWGNYEFVHISVLFCSLQSQCRAPSHGCVMFQIMQNLSTAARHVPTALRHVNGLCSPACFNFQLSARSVSAISRHFLPFHPGCCSHYRSV